MSEFDFDINQFNGFPFSFKRTEPFIPGTLIKRYKRFLSDIELEDGKIITAHCVNTGRMEGLTRPGTKVWVSPANNPKRKLKYTWELTEIDGHIIGTNTSFPNRFVQLLLENRMLDFYGKYESVKPEVKVGPSHRVDFFLEKKRGKSVYVEVKNCHLIYPDLVAYFPDSVSERATKHLHGLLELMDEKHLSEVLFFCQIPTVEKVKPSDAHDPTFAQMAREVGKKGLKFRSIAISQDAESVTVLGAVPVDLKPYQLEKVLAWKKENERLSKQPI